MPFNSVISLKDFIYFFISLILVGFGQPAFSELLALFSAAFGWAPIFLLLTSYKKAAKRFFVGTLFFFLVQLIQLSWLVSHPFLYIWIVYFILALLAGLQFGILALLITKKNAIELFPIFVIAAVWTLLEWSRLFFLSGFSFNPAGLALSASLYPLQLASIGGIFFLTFWVMITNLLAARLRLTYPVTQLKKVKLFIFFAAFPYLFGYYHVNTHSRQLEQQNDNFFQALLIQTAFPTEETLSFANRKAYIQYIEDEWRTIFTLTAPHLSPSKELDLIVLPEFTVPFGTYTPTYSYDEVKQVVEEVFGDEGIKAMPPKTAPWAYVKEKTFLVNNSFWAQTLANLFNAPLIMGLEDAEYLDNGEIAYYSGALFFQPSHLHDKEGAAPKRYAKRILVPMGEYIPFALLKKLVKRYGVSASFTPGEAAEVFIAGKNHHPFSPSICYEETFGDLMREGCLAGAKMLVNLTSDVWYPNSRLPKQHFDLARLRTVENGVPLLRACNTGITCAVDSLGRIVSELKDEKGQSEWVAAALQVEVSTYHYQTLYTKVGDKLILFITLIILLIYGGFLMLKKTFLFP